MHGAPLRQQPVKEGEERATTEHQHRRASAAAFAFLGRWLLGCRPLWGGPGAGA